MSETVKRDSDCSKLDASGQDALPHEIMGRAVILDNLYNLENLHRPMFYFTFF